MWSTLSLSPTLGGSREHLLELLIKLLENTQSLQPMCFHRGCTRVYTPYVNSCRLRLLPVPSSGVIPCLDDEAGVANLSFDTNLKQDGWLYDSDHHSNEADV